MDNADEECGVPSEDDERWWASQNDEWHDLASDEDDIEHRAGVAEVLAMMEIGLWPY
jgi:hypothetical protein